MGLDLIFDRQSALNSGIETSEIRNGDDDEIREAEADYERDQYPQDGDYLDWLRTYQTVVRVPGMDWWVSDDGFSDTIQVRANKWGRSYAPITDWLTANGIDWTEV